MFWECGFTRGWQLFWKCINFEFRLEVFVSVWFL
jgi:hypothetical protein